MPRVIVIEDDPDVREILRQALADAGHEVRTAAGGLEGLRLAREQLPALVLLDLTLPDIAGTSVLQQLKLEAPTRAARVIIVSASGEEIDRIIGFELGADDYVVKPFSLRELILRTEAVLRRTASTPATKVVTCGRLQFDPEAHRVWVDGSEVKLTAGQFRLLVILYSNQRRVQSRGQLLTHMWGAESEGAQSEYETRTIDNLVKRLRERLGGAGKYIQAVRGVGYRFSAEPEK
jgi:two-component system phosphate regulon response regulator PhoB